jgi:bifunctional NMN adenylyltransferase/nudix hydrolase
MPNPLAPDLLRATRLPRLLCGGYFQPPHQSDLALLRSALARAQLVVVVIMAAHQARSPRHPLSWRERADLIAACLSPAETARLRFLPLRESADQSDADRLLRSEAQGLLGDDALPLLPRMGWPSDSHQPWLAGVDPSLFIDAGAPAPEDAASLRDQWFNTDAPARALDRLAGAIPAPVLSWLKDWSGLAIYSKLREEWRVLRDHQRAWSAAPYPPIFVTVDAVVHCNGHVLLIRRGKAPGEGLLAVPGGFLEPQDTLLESALRELQEETGLALSESEWRRHFREVVVFDAPARSQRGRTITHAHYFDLGQRDLPAVAGADDAREALWLPLADIPALEDQFFDDHFLMLTRREAPAG